MAHDIAHRLGVRTPNRALAGEGPARARRADDGPILQTHGRGRDDFGDEDVRELGDNLHERISQGLGHAAVAIGGALEGDGAVSRASQAGAGVGDCDGLPVARGGVHVLVDRGEEVRGRGAGAVELGERVVKEGLDLGFGDGHGGVRAVVHAGAVEGRRGAGAIDVHVGRGLIEAVEAAVCIGARARVASD